MTEFAINGVTKNVYDGCFAPPQKERNTTTPELFKTITDEIRRERALVELKEIETIREKAPEDRTLEERIKLAAFNLDKAAEFIDKYNPVVYVA